MAVDADLIDIFVEYIRRVRGSLFHVTDRSHLGSIEKYGLLSKAERDRLGIDPPLPGGDAFTTARDREHGLWEYVFLGFTETSVMPAHREEARFRRSCIIRVDPAILYQPGVRVALGRANQSAKSYAVRSAIKEIDVELELFHQVLTGTFDQDDFAIRPKVIRIFNYEILVPNIVPLDYLSA